jgi:CP family cyanate transporter-like MFS transporter
MLWLAGIALRATILAVPPVLPAIHHDLHLTEAAVGALTALPVLLLSVAAVFGSLLVARLGARRALLLGIATVACAGAARSIGSSAPVLFLMTFLMGAGVAISQPTLPSLVRQWFPLRTAAATATYSNGILVGEIIAASLTVPVILPLLGYHWQLVLVFWSGVVAVIGLALLILTAHEPRPADAAPVRWWPDWHSRRTWTLGFVLGCASLAYFGGNAFIPDYLKSTHHAGLVSAALTSLNLSQFPSSLLVFLAPQLLIGRRWPIMVAGLLALISAAGCLMGGVWVVVWAGLLGFSTAFVLVLALALPPLLTEQDDVHRLTAAMFTITYACSFVGSLLGGAIWDATGSPATAFLPVAASGLAMAALAQLLDIGEARTAMAVAPALRR